MVLKRVDRRLNRANRRPAIATYPRAFTAANNLRFQVGVFNVAVMRLYFNVRRRAIAPRRILVRAIRVRTIANRLMRLNRCQRRRVRDVEPPPRLILFRIANVTRRLLNADRLVIDQVRVVRICMDLRAGLPIARGRRILSFAMNLMSPAILIVTINTAPAIILTPLITMFMVNQLSNRSVGLRIANMVNYVIPRYPLMKQVINLPVIINLFCRPRSFDQTNLFLY